MNWSAFTGLSGQRRGGRSAANFGIEFTIAGCREDTVGGVKGCVCGGGLFRTPCREEGVGFSFGLGSVVLAE